MQIQNQIPKVRNFKMISHKNNESQGSSIKHDFQTEIHHNEEKNNNIPSSQDEILSEEENSDDHVHDTKYTMENLCKSFIKKYANTNIPIEPSLISTQFNAKLRRIYDLTSILQGGGIIQKVEKGVYKWKGLTKRNQLPYEMLKNDWCSLRCISFEIKKLFNKMKKGLTCNDLTMILTNGNKNRFNPATIRRKIYECCKVFVNVGLIKKSGKQFYSGQMSQKEIQSQKIFKIEQQIIHKPSKINSSQCPPPQSHINQIHLKQPKPDSTYNNKRENLAKLQQRKAIIRKVVKEIENQSDLTKFIQEISEEYYRLRKLQILDENKDYGKEFVCDRNTECVETQEWSPRNTPQLQRNIIISSPPKQLYPHLVVAMGGIRRISTPRSNTSSFQPLKSS